MNLHQFRFVQEAVRRNLNLTEAARALHTSQPGVSKAIIELEEELGIEIFARHGKRIKRITEPGQHVLKSIELILREVGNLKRIGEQYSAEDSGTLSIATTHTQARYVLPEPVARLREDLSALGLARDDSMSETEDHFACLCEVMRYLIAGDDVAVSNLTHQGEFFAKHIQAWASDMAEVIAKHPKAKFFGKLAEFTQAFLAIEAQGFDLLT